MMDSAKLLALLEHDCRAVVLESTTSTNDEVVRRAALGDARSSSAPLVVVSAEQTAGRGRLGRVWASPPGGVYLSMLFGQGVNGVPEELLASLSPLVALSLRHAFGQFTHDDPHIKWPNDVLTARGKLAGVLVEVKRGNRTPSAESTGARAAGVREAPALAPASVLALASASAPALAPASVLALASATVPVSPASDFALQLIVGVGVNVNRPLAGAFAGAAYLNDGAKRELSREAVAAAVINSVLERQNQWRAHGCSFAPFVAEYQEHFLYQGARVCVRDAMGAEVASGIVTGIDEWGRLLLEGAGGVSAVAAGEVTLRDV
ncbi:MAG: biotin--[acetyl-CoA-carboxylase] ligase [Coriobacteriales bacterium]|jgi:BirA family biotin operon repressor/biotin-[acetyl-CoA-carboxylase] ligase|nr:biotin--[acetyl-CoA-carboxylase] ligase [Coriobacteriales bacterium]